MEESERIQRAELPNAKLLNAEPKNAANVRLNNVLLRPVKHKPNRKLLRKKTHWQLKNAHFKRVLKKQSVKPLPNAINWHNWKRQRKPLPSVNLPKQQRQRKRQGRTC